MSHLFLALCNSTWELEPIFDVSTLVQHVRRAVESPSATPKPTEFRFELLTEAAAHSWSVLKKCDRSLSRALEAQGGSPLQPGSELRDLSLLEPILGRHPLWPRFRSILDSGSDWALDPVSDESRLDSVTKNIGRGNHKSARDRPEVLKDQVLDDVTRCFALPLPAKVAPLIPGAEVAPMGLVAQNTISEAGEIMPKDRLTHDQSFEIGTARSVNNRARMEDHQPASGVRPCPPASDPPHRRRPSQASPRSHPPAEGRFQGCVSPGPLGSQHGRQNDHHPGWHCPHVPPADFRRPPLPERMVQHIRIGGRPGQGPPAMLGLGPVRAPQPPAEALGSPQGGGRRCAVRAGPGHDRDPSRQQGWHRRAVHR